MWVVIEQRIGALKEVATVTLHIREHTDSASMGKLAETVEVIAAILREVIEEHAAERSALGFPWPA